MLLACLASLQPVRICCDSCVVARYVGNSAVRSYSRNIPTITPLIHFINNNNSPYLQIDVARILSSQINADIRTSYNGQSILQMRLRERGHRAIIQFNSLLFMC
jgi:hypothetical protein